jgi:hypothetical protein
LRVNRSALKVQELKVEKFQEKIWRRERREEAPLLENRGRGTAEKKKNH